MSLYCIQAVLLLDAEGERIACKYYPGELPALPGLATLKEQKAFEKALHNKTRTAYADVVMLDKQIAVYKTQGDVTIYVLGSHDDNELVLSACLDTLSEALETMQRGNFSKRTLLDNYDYVLLCLDETVDRGVLLETDAQLVAARCAMSDRGAAQFTPLHEQTLAQILDTAKDQIIRNLKN